MYNRILFILKREEKPAICNNMDELEDIVLREIKRSLKDYCMIPLE